MTRASPPVERLLTTHAISIGATEVMMERATLQDRTFNKVPMQVGGYRDVYYRVYRDGSKH